MSKKLLSLFLVGALLFSPVFIQEAEATVNATYTPTQYSGPAAGPFAFSWNIFEKADIVVQVLDSVGTFHTLALTTDYTISTTTYPNNGNIVLAPGGSWPTLPAGDTLIISRGLPITQLISISDYSPTPASTWNEAFDRATMIEQQLQNQLNRSFLQPINYTGSAIVFPTLVANQVIEVDPTGSFLITAPYSTADTAAAAASASAASGYASTASGYATTASGYATAASNSATSASNSAISTAADVVTMNGIVAAGGIVRGDGSVNPTNLLSNGDFECWSAGSSAAPDGWVNGHGTGVTVARADGTGGTHVKLGVYSCGITCNNVVVFYQDSSSSKGIAYWKGRTVVFGCWVWCATGTAARLAIDDGDGASDVSSYHTGDSTWQWLTVTSIIGSNATNILTELILDTASTAYFDGAMCVEGESAFAFSDKPMPYGNGILPATNGGTGTTGSLLGAWSNNLSGACTDVHATTDGFVCAVSALASAPDVQGFTNTGSPANVLRIRGRNYDNGGANSYGTIMMPVKKGDYWTVSGASGGTVYWIPLGS